MEKEIKLTGKRTTKTGSIDWWKHSHVAYHIKIFFAGMMITALFLWFMVHRVEWSVFISTFPLVFIQVEIFLWLGGKFFPDRYIERQTTGVIIRDTIIRFFLFFMVVTVIAAAIFFLALLVRVIISHQSVNTLFSNFLRYESKGFFIGMTTGLLGGIIIFLYFQWREALSREQKLKEEKLIFRYETLKNQVNPHFLFNSLNTLASLVETNPSGAGSFISKLAAIYRYVLDKKELDLVPLPEELAFAGNYFDLQKIRDGEKIRLVTRIPDPDFFKILPISLQILLENVFKHNIASVENPLTITVQLAEDGYLEVTNPLRIKNIRDITPGTGLRNLGERTRLITGRDIRIVEKHDEFMVRIPLIPAEHENTDRGR